MTRDQEEAKRRAETARTAPPRHIPEREHRPAEAPDRGTYRPTPPPVENVERDWARRGGGTSGERSARRRR